MLQPLYLFYIPILTAPFYPHVRTISLARSPALDHLMDSYSGHPYIKTELALSHSSI
jgi:hypothetical protein